MQPREICSLVRKEDFGVDFDGHVSRDWRAILRAPRVLGAARKVEAVRKENWCNAVRATDPNSRDHQLVGEDSNTKFNDAPSCGRGMEL